jgi:hypothetical protein
MTTTTETNGRLGNQIIRNLVVSLIAEKHDLYVNYSSYDLINELGIELFVGNYIYLNEIILTDENFFSIYETEFLHSNLNPNKNYFQTKEITNYIYNHIRSDKIKNNIINKNPFRERYNMNNDLFIHIRLTDVAYLNPGINYYLYAMSKIDFDNIYISTDERHHFIVQTIISEYPNAILIDYDVIQTMQFASTCKNIILSHGSYSAIIGYLSFYSTVNYPEYDFDKLIWYGDMFSIDGWVKHLISLYMDTT